MNDDLLALQKTALFWFYKRQISFGSTKDTRFTLLRNRSKDPCGEFLKLMTRLLNKYK